MSIPLFFAMSGEDIQKNVAPPPHIAWMSCHFSPYGPGLVDFPYQLPKDSMLILDDRIPMDGHDPDLIIRQLRAAVSELQCSYLLLELQQKNTAVPVERIVKEVPCAVGVTPHYAKGIDCAVFLPPVPPHITLSSYLTPWLDRQIWLEVALDGTDLTVTSTGSTITPVPFPEEKMSAHRDEALCCHYSISTQPEAACFSLYRTLNDIEELLRQAPHNNITLAIGLYQELSPLAAK